MPCTSYCFNHILHDQRQTLYECCQYVNQFGKQCDKPVVICASQPLCCEHTQVECATFSRSRKSKRTTESADAVARAWQNQTPQVQQVQQQQQQQQQQPQQQAVATSTMVQAQVPAAYATTAAQPSSAMMQNQYMAQLMQQRGMQPTMQGMQYLQQALRGQTPLTAQPMSSQVGMPFKLPVTTASGVSTSTAAVVSTVSGEAAAKTSPATGVPDTAPAQRSWLQPKQ